MKTNLKYLLCLVILLGVWQCVHAQDEICEDTDTVVIANEAITGASFNQWIDSEPFKKGVEALDFGDDYNGAATLFIEELKLHPNNGYAMCNLAICKNHIANATLNKATYDILNLPDIDMETADTLYKVARINFFVAMGETIETMENGIELLPTDDKNSLSKAYIALAEALNDAEIDTDEVMAVYKKAVDVNPCEESIYELIGYAKNKNLDEDILEVINKYGDLLSDDIISKTYFALNAYNNGEYQKAIDLLKEALKNDSESYDAKTISLMGESYYMLGDVDKALVLMDEAIKQNAQSGDSGNNEYITRKIAIEMDNGMVDKVLHDAQVAEIVCAGNVDDLMNIYSAQGWANSVKKNWKEALAAYDKWSEMTPGNYTPLYIAARTKILSGDIAQGREELRDILNNMDTTENQEFKMNVLYYLGNKTEAKAILDVLAKNTETVGKMNAKEALEYVLTNETMLLYNVACAYSLQGETGKALDYLRQYFESDEGEPNFEYVILDYDFDNIRNNPKFLELINEYRLKWKNGKFRSKQ